MKRGVTNDLVRTVGRKNQHGADDDGHRSRDEGGQTSRSFRGEMDSMDTLTSGVDGGKSYAVGEKVGARLGGRSLWFVEARRSSGTGTGPTIACTLRGRQGARAVYINPDPKLRIRRRRGRREERKRSNGGDRVAHHVGDDIEAGEVQARAQVVPPAKCGCLIENARLYSYGVRHTYRDEEIERYVAAAFVRRIGGVNNRHDAGRASFSVMDNVEWRFGSNSRWFMATMERKNRDETLLHALG